MQNDTTKSILFQCGWLSSIHFSPVRFPGLINGELCTWFDKLKLCFLFFYLKIHYSLLFALQCPPVYKPEALGPGIVIRAKVEQKGRVIIIGVINQYTAPG